MICCPRFLANLSLADKLMKAVTKLQLTACTLLLLIQGSWAHAFVDHAEPAVGSQIRSAPTQVKIWFTEKLEPARVGRDFWLCFLTTLYFHGFLVCGGLGKMFLRIGSATNDNCSPATSRPNR